MLDVRRFVLCLFEKATGVLVDHALRIGTYGMNDHESINTVWQLSSKARGLD